MRIETVYTKKQTQLKIIILDEGCVSRSQAFEAEIGDPAIFK
jgi:hypothetical protein